MDPQKCSKGLWVTRNLIMKKAIVMYGDMVKEDDSNEKLKARIGWIKGFIKRYGLSLRRKTSVTQKDSDQLIDNLLYFVLHVCRLVTKHLHNAADIITMNNP